MRSASTSRRSVAEPELEPAEIVPKEIDGFTTDVITVRREIPLIGFNNENDTTNYKVKVGGIRIGNNKLTGQGTLGCFCRRTTDNKVVFLSNYHVLYDGGAQNGSEVGQGQVRLLVLLHVQSHGRGDRRRQEPRLRDREPRQRRAVHPEDQADQEARQHDRAERVHHGRGRTTTVSADEVWKIGSRTGLTRGTVSQVAPIIEIHPKAPFTYVADHGDSGSVVVRLSNGNVVGLLRAIDKEISAGGSLGLAVPIAAVLARLNITVLTTDASQSYDVSLIDEPIDRLTRVAPGSGFDAIAARLRASPAGTALLERLDEHRIECVQLVNTCRPVTVAWHRNQGPGYMAALARSAKVPEYRIPEEIEGVARAAAAQALGQVFERHGSEELRVALAEHGPRLRDVLLRANTVDEVIGAWEATEPALAREPVG